MFTTQLAKVQYDAVFVNSEWCMELWNSDRNKTSEKIVYVLVVTDECESDISQAKGETYGLNTWKFLIFVPNLQHFWHWIAYLWSIAWKSPNLLCWAFQVLWTCGLSDLLCRFFSSSLFVTCCMMDQGNPKYLVYTFCDEILLLHTFGINWTRCRASRIHSNKGDI